MRALLILSFRVCLGSMDGRVFGMASKGPLPVNAYGLSLGVDEVTLGIATTANGGTISEGLAGAVLHVMWKPTQAFWTSVKTQIGLLAETPETQSSLGHGTWPQLMYCALVAVWVPEVGRGWVGASEQGGSSDNDQDSE